MSGTGHYTQMVWASTYKIGCGYAAYRKRNFVKKFIVCNYGDAGNLLNAPMYQVGRPCSKCPANICSRRFPGLCPVPGETGFSPSNSTMVDINTDVESIRPSTPAGSDGKNYFMFRSFHLLFLATFGNKVTKIRKYYVIFVYVLQGKMGKTEKNEPKIMQLK